MTSSRRKLGPVIREAPLGELKVYRVYEHQLDELAQGSPVSLVAQFLALFPRDCRNGGGDPVVGAAGCGPSLLHLPDPLPRHAHRGRGAVRRLVQDTNLDEGTRRGHQVTDAAEPGGDTGRS